MHSATRSLRKIPLLVLVCFAVTWTETRSESRLPWPHEPRYGLHSEVVWIDGSEGVVTGPPEYADDDWYYPVTLSKSGMTWLLAERGLFLRHPNYGLPFSVGCRWASESATSKPSFVSR
jgi:hypothetical protein